MLLSKEGGIEMSFIWSLIVGGIIGAIAGAFLGKDVPGGIIGNIVAGFVGSWIGSSLFPNLEFGPVIGGFNVVPALVGAVILIFIVSFAMRSMKK